MSSLAASFLDLMQIHSASGDSSVVAQSAVEIDFQSRLKRSLKSFGLFAGLAICCLPIPGLHFFLVPSFLFYGIYSGLSKWKQKYSLQMTGIVCPHCKQPLKNPVEFFSQLPLRIYCYGCRNQLRIQD